jgi:O-antigen/teichoic acid export membrane protein
MAGALSGIFVGDLMAALLSVGYTTRFLKWRGCQLKPLPVWGILKFGLSSMLYSAMALALYRADMLLIRYLTSDSQAGLYAAAVRWAEFVFFVPIAVQGVMLQATSQQWAERRTVEITALLSRVLRYVALGTAFPLVVVFGLAEEILWLYFGPDFIGASLALRILVPGVFSLSLARVMWPVIQACGCVIWLVAVMAMATAANLGLNWWLIPHWGAVGAATSSCVSYGSVVFGNKWILRDYGVQPFRRQDGGRLLLLCTVIGGILPVIAAPMPSALVAVIAGVILAFFGYGAGALWLGLIRVDEIQQIIESLPDRLRTPSVRVLGKLQPALLRIEIGSLKKLKPQGNRHGQ